MRIRTGHLDTELLAAFCISTVLATAVIVVPSLLYGKLMLWAKLAVPALLLCGLAGVIFRIGILRAAGWAGIILYLLITLSLSIPSEEYLYGPPELGGPPDGKMRIVSGWQILGFWATYWTIGYGLWASLTKLGAQARREAIPSLDAEPDRAG